MKNPLEKFSNNYEKSLKVAANLAIELNHEKINPEHIFFGLIMQRGSVGAELLNNVKSDDIKNNIAKINQIQKQIKTKVSPEFSDRSKEIIQKSVQIAYINHHKYIGTEHLLAAILQIDNSKIKELFSILNISEKELTQQVVSVLKSTSKLPNLTETFKVSNKKDDNLNNPYFPTQSNTLDLFSNNLTSVKAQKKIDPVIGRDEEIKRIIQILSRRTKNNPIILGDPGVGKTAIIEGLAKKIVVGDVPEILRNKKIYSIDLTAMIAGTMYRGEFENRIKQIIEETKRRKNIILFIDEIHNIVGAGSASGSMDTANILKPALARGEIHCIGATTFSDYRKSIENDPALDRRFQAVKIYEPTTEQTKNILFGIKKYFENFHRVKITDNAIESAVTLSQKYLPEKFLPDKAIDLIDEACSSVKVGKNLSPSEKKLKDYKNQLKKLQQDKEQTILIENYQQAIIIKEQIKEIEEKIEKIIQKQKNQNNKLKDQINETNIAKVISKMTGIPAENLVASEKKKLLKLDRELNQQIIGQEKPIEIISNFIKRAKAGLTAGNKPLGSFIFIGPSGVGKTYSAKVLSEKLFNTPDSLIRIDMSEYSEKFNISKLIGAPAGYVGYKESGQLTEKIKHKPYSIVLFDEIEKANPEIFNLLLQILDDGYLTDASGTKINFRNTVIIMTSNIGSQYFHNPNNIGFNEETENTNLEEKILAEAKKHFKVEFLNRLDKIIYFNCLNSKAINKIIVLELEKLKKHLETKKIFLDFDNSIVKLIAKKNNNIDQGARGIKKIIQEEIETFLSQKILEEKINYNDKLKILFDKNSLIINKK